MSESQVAGIQTLDSTMKVFGGYPVCMMKIENHEIRAI